jgi:hypothetical protein
MWTSYVSAMKFGFNGLVGWMDGRLMEMVGEWRA